MGIICIGSLNKQTCVEIPPYIQQLICIENPESDGNENLLNASWDIVRKYIYISETLLLWCLMGIKWGTTLYREPALYAQISYSTTKL